MSQRLLACHQLALLDRIGATYWNFTSLMEDLQKVGNPMRNGEMENGTLSWFTNVEDRKAGRTVRQGAKGLANTGCTIQVFAQFTFLCVGQ